MTAQSMPPGGRPLTFVQTQQLHRSLTEKVLDRAESDPEWRQLLIDDPELAMREANFPEAQQLEQQGEVVGHGWGSQKVGCRWIWTWHGWVRRTY